MICSDEDSIIYLQVVPPLKNTVAIFYLQTCRIDDTFQVITNGEQIENFRII